jgi:hypothetical protein
LLHSKCCFIKVLKKEPLVTRIFFSWGIFYFDCLSSVQEEKKIVVTCESVFVSAMSSNSTSKTFLGWLACPVNLLPSKVLWLEKCDGLYGKWFLRAGPDFPTLAGFFPRPLDFSHGYWGWTVNPAIQRPVHCGISTFTWADFWTAWHGIYWQLWRF